MAINDSWRGMITLEGASLKSFGKFFCMLKVFLSSLMGKSHKPSNSFVIVSESSMRPGTSVFLYRGSDCYVRSGKWLVPEAPKFGSPSSDLRASYLGSL